MKIRIGYELIYDIPQPTPMILMLSVHETRRQDLLIADPPQLDPPIPLRPIVIISVTVASVLWLPRDGSAFQPMP